MQRVAWQPVYQIVLRHARKFIGWTNEKVLMMNDDINKKFNVKCIDYM